MRKPDRKSGAGLLALLAGAVFVSGVSSSYAQSDHSAAQVRAKYDFGQPYLSGPLPGGKGLVPPAPAEGSAIAERDSADNQRYLETLGNARWQLAARDADLSTGWYARAFSCASGYAIDDGHAPAIAQLLRRAGADFGSSTSGVKALYQRARPFMVNGGPICTPDDEAGLRGNGSYPSGHSAIGFGTSLVLASIFPDNAAVLVARGREFGTSRAVCNVHWSSDVEEGQIMASATFARLMANEAFRSDLAKAQAEAATLSAAPDPASCANEAAQLGAPEE